MPTTAFAADTMDSRSPNRQQGVFLLEALIAILIFSLGILGMMGIAGVSVASQSDAQYRTEASDAAQQVVNTISLKVDRTTPTSLAGTLTPFVHQAGGGNCAFAGPKTHDADVLAVFAGASLPSANDTTAQRLARQQILVDTTAANYNRVTVTLCWKAGTDTNWRHLTLVSYVH